MPTSTSWPNRSLLAGLVLAGALLGTPSVAQQAQPAAPREGQAQQPARPAAQQGQQNRPAAQQQQQQQQNQALATTRIPPPGFGELPLFGARELEHTEMNFKMLVPAGWIADGASADQQQGVIGRMILEGPGLPAPSCLMAIVQNQVPAGITQQRINQALHQDQNVNNLRRQLGQRGNRVADLRRITRGGVAGFSARIIAPGNAQRPEVTLYMTFLEAVGRRYTVECQVLTADMQTHQRDVEQMLASLEILPRRPAAGAQTPAQPAAAAQPQRPAAPAQPRAQQ